MRAHRNSSTEILEQKTHQLNHDRPNLRQPGKGVSHQPPVLLLSKVRDGTIIQSEVRPTVVQLKRSAKLLTFIGLTTKHAVCRITFML